MTADTVSEERHIHDPGCGHCPRCGEDLPSEADYCDARRPSHWYAYEGWDIPENRADPDPAAAPPADEAAPPEPTPQAQPRRMSTYRLVFPNGEELALVPGEARRAIGRSLPALAAFKRVTTHHADVWVDIDGDFYIADIGNQNTGSLNGTFYRDRRLRAVTEEARIEPGDQVRLADAVYIRFVRRDA